jgi:hypothetical protein
VSRISRSSGRNSCIIRWSRSFMAAAPACGRARSLRGRPLPHAPSSERASLPSRRGQPHVGDRVLPTDCLNDGFAVRFVVVREVGQERLRQPIAGALLLGAAGVVSAEAGSLPTWLDPGRIAPLPSARSPRLMGRCGCAAMSADATGDHSMAWERAASGCRPIYRQLQ